MSPKGRRITASQIGQYAYCAHAWWLGIVEGCEPVNLGAMDAGLEAHERHGWRVSLAQRLNKLALVLFGVALLSLLGWLVVAIAR